MNKIATKSLHEILVTKAEDHDGLTLKIFDVVDCNITVVELRREEIEDLYKECFNALFKNTV